MRLGENFYGPRAMHEAIRAQACDLVMPDLMRIGGVTADPVLARPSQVRDGTVLVPDVPGNGLEWDEDAVTHDQSSN